MVVTLGLLALRGCVQMTERERDVEGAGRILTGAFEGIISLVYGLSGVDREAPDCSGIGREAAYHVHDWVQPGTWPALIFACIEVVGRTVNNIGIPTASDSSIDESDDDEVLHSTDGGDGFPRLTYLDDVGDEQE